MKKISKKFLVEITSKMILDEGIENLSIRKVAKEAGCTSGTLYLYFKNFDHLLLISCFKFLKGYVEEISKINNSFENSEEENIKIWELFCKHAFKNPKIYYFIFFVSSKLFSEVNENSEEYYEIKEYYKLYLEELKNFPNRYYKMILKLDLEERNKFLIQKMAKEKLISYSHVTLLNLNQIFIFKGYLERAKNSSNSIEQERLMRSCMRSLKFSIKSYKNF